MKRLDPDKLFVEFRPCVTKTEPLLGRRYTLTHSDATAELFLTVGLAYAYDKVTTMRDEVLAEWRINHGSPYLFVYVFVDGQYGSNQSTIRDTIFRRELPLALEAIMYGDQCLFKACPELDLAPIFIRFDSTIPRYNRYEYWGTPIDYQ
ncbi:staygreen family protein [Halobacillus faecis]|uniref:Staygreen protein domain-containing protein n=1 Tax=Halobacillus faecis TaxID=360184 RepID=A0A511WU67_9BACI|nr:staygreen family protein [Halobacillus faecis]GEN53823.1 hypothetical protein HFA01_20850 [Halobacillus faecis]